MSKVGDDGNIGKVGRVGTCNKVSDIDNVRNVVYIGNSYEVINIVHIPDSKDIH